jgi:ABC-2 type transport system ATP-binding protein
VVNFLLYFVVTGIEEKGINDMVHLEILGVTKYVNESFQLEIGELRLNKGGITGLVGENGAGKTTLMKSICGLVNIDSGEISYKGCSVHTHLEELLKQIGSTFISVEGLGDKRLEDLYEEQVFYYQI